MKACLRSLTVAVAAATLVAGAGTLAAWAQGEWKAPADQKSVKNPLADKKTPPLTRGMDFVVID